MPHIGRDNMKKRNYATDDMDIVLWVSILCVAFTIVGICIGRIMYENIKSDTRITALETKVADCKLQIDDCKYSIKYHREFLQDGLIEAMGLLKYGDFLFARLDKSKAKRDKQDQLDKASF